MVEGLFEKLHLFTKATLLWEHGEIVSERKHDNCEVNAVTLYKLFSFHVEVFCDIHFNEIEDIKIISDDRLVQLYLPGN